MKITLLIASIIVLGLVGYGAARPHLSLRAGHDKTNNQRRSPSNNDDQEIRCECQNPVITSPEVSGLVTPSKPSSSTPLPKLIERPTTTPSNGTRNPSSIIAGISIQSKNANPDKLWGLNYSPFRVGRCSTPEEIKVDLALVASVASNIRLFSMNDCNNAEIVLENLPSGMQVMLGVWLASFDTELATLIRLAKIKGFQGKVAGVSVGSEVLYRNEMSSADLITKIRQVRSALADAGQPSVKITCSEPLQLWNLDLLNVVDILFPTVYPFFGKLDIQGSVAKTMAWMDSVTASGSLTSKTMIISEIGWPSSGASNGKASPSIQIEIDHIQQILCFARKSNTKYFLFEAFDAAWKTGQNQWEQSFGVFNADRTRKINWNSGDC